jgi:hypothetical protein
MNLFLFACKRLPLNHHQVDQVDDWKETLSKEFFDKIKLPHGEVVWELKKNFLQ